LVTALVDPSECFQTANATEPAGLVDTPVAHTTHSDSSSNHEADTAFVDTHSEASQTEQNDQADGLFYTEALLTQGDNSISSDDPWAVEPVVNKVSGIICRAFSATHPMLESSQLI
jgi:hypothetical protein